MPNSFDVFFVESSESFPGYVRPHHVYPTVVYLPVCLPAYVHCGCSALLYYRHEEANPGRILWWWCCSTRHAPIYLSASLSVRVVLPCRHPVFGVVYFLSCVSYMFPTVGVDPTHTSGLSVEPTPTLSRPRRGWASLNYLFFSVYK